MSPQNHSYNADAMIGRPPIKDAPPFGQRLAAARQARGLTQRELADLIGTTRQMVDYYERRAVNPALEVIQKCAKALGLPLSALLGEETPPPRRAKPGPVSQLQRRFELIKKLPRKEQEFILKFLDTVLERSQKS